MALVSVLLPTYNRVRYLEDAVQSVFDQTYHDLECLVVDGGSTDGTCEYLNSIDDQRVQVLRRDQPQGIADARNCGLEQASGDYVVFLDDDDRLLKHAVSTLVETIQRQPDSCAGVYSRHLRSGDAPQRIDRPISGRRVGDVHDANIIGPTCTLVRSDALDEIGGFDESFPSLEDADLWIRLFESYHMIELDVPLFERRSHDDQLTRDPELMIAGEKRLLDKHGKSQSARWRAARYARIAHFNVSLGRTDLARTAMRSALVESPSTLPYYYLALLLMIGPDTYRTGRRFALGIRSRLHNLASHR